MCYIKENEERFGRGHFIQAILANQVVCFGTFTEEDIEKFKDKTFILNNILNPNKLHKEKPFFRGENERVDFKKLEEDLRTRNLDFYTIKDAQRLLQDKLKNAYFLWRDKFVTSQEYFGLDI